MIEFQKNNASLSFSEVLLKGKDGEDGGYYKPSINNNLISWQPSKTDMPQVDDFALSFRAEDIIYTHSKLSPTQQEDGVKGALDFLLSYTPHTHYNKAALDRLSTDSSASSTALYINGRSNKIALEPKNFNYTQNPPTTLYMTNNTNYQMKDVKTLSIIFPTSPSVGATNTLWLTFSNEGAITVTFPAGTRYIGTIPSFKNGETWEIDIFNKIVSFYKVGDGTEVQNV